MEITPIEQEECTSTATDIFYSQAEKENLHLIKKEFDGEFPVGAVFATRRDLIDAMRQKATKFGFFIVDRGMAACCSETTSRDAQDARKQLGRNWLLREMEKPICRENLQDQSVGVNSRLTYRDEGQ
ncbi:hypothetical protein MHU86_11387 [Fragilaria crotonensis]|nr:hypothetical protein MHU86_11387 [Fragilaria crotonensis]